MLIPVTHLDLYTSNKTMVIAQGARIFQPQCLQCPVLFVDPIKVENNIITGK